MFGNDSDVDAIEIAQKSVSINFQQKQIIWGKREFKLIG